MDQLIKNAPFGTDFTPQPKWRLGKRCVKNTNTSTKKTQKDERCNTCGITNKQLNTCIFKNYIIIN